LTPGGSRRVKHDDISTVRPCGSITVITRGNNRITGGSRTVRTSDSNLVKLDGSIE
jgi:hypothetical protein